MLSMSSAPAYEFVPLPVTPPSVSPPPRIIDHPPPQQPSPALSEDSIIDLSFSYEQNANGDWVRVSKGSSKSSPPTSSSSEQPSPVSLESPIPTRRASLSRSESAPQIPDSATTARSFQRVQSGPLAATPGVSTARLPFSTGLTTAARKIGGARRVRLEDIKEATDRSSIRPEAEDLRQRELRFPSQEKENADSFPAPSYLPPSRPLAEVVPVPQRNVSVHGRQVLPVPSRRVVKKVETISEDVSAEENVESRPYAGLPTGIRPRRSASLSEASPDMPPPQFQHVPRLAIHTKGARRVTLEEKLRQERQIALEEGYARREAEEEAERRAHAQAEAQAAAAQMYTRQTPSPPNLNSQQPHLRPLYGHQRKDSDTLRSAAMPPAGSPTVMEMLPTRLSPPMRTNSGSGVYPNSLQANPDVGYAITKHRRSPTAPEPSTTSGEAREHNGYHMDDGGMIPEQERVNPPPQKPVPSMPPPPIPASHMQPPVNVQPQQQQQQAPQPQQVGQDIRTRNMMVSIKS
ncbi:hypothetical protein C8Q75DRAFT_333303 [Abortiporus biennis]|nr:hypothetical protein C8Q75DRAFT_333303 [Abortiporus biennis]